MMYVLKCIWVVSEYESLNWAEWNYSNPQKWSIIFHFPLNVWSPPSTLHSDNPSTHTCSWLHMWTLTCKCKLRVRPVFFAFVWHSTYPPWISSTSHYFTPTTTSVSVVRFMCVEVSHVAVRWSVCATASRSEMQQREEVQEEKVSEVKQQQQALEILV